MPTATIKLFLVNGDPKRLRTAELSNWTSSRQSAEVARGGVGWWAEDRGVSCQASLIDLGA